MMVGWLVLVGWGGWPFPSFGPGFFPSLESHNGDKFQGLDASF